MKNIHRTCSARLIALALLVCLLLGCCVPALAGDELFGYSVEEAAAEAASEQFFTIEWPDTFTFLVGQTYTVRVVPDASLKKDADGHWSGQIDGMDFSAVDTSYSVDTDHYDDLDVRQYQADDAFVFEITPLAAGSFSFAPVLFMEIRNGGSTVATYGSYIYCDFSAFDAGDLLTISTENTGAPMTMYVSVYEDLGDDALGYLDWKNGVPKGTDLCIFVDVQTNFQITSVLVTDENGRTLYRNDNPEYGFDEFTLTNVQRNLKISACAVPLSQPYGSMLYPFYGDAKTEYAEIGFTDEYPLYGDVKPTDWFFDAVYQLWSSNIIDAYLDFSYYAPAALVKENTDADCFYPSMNQPRGLTAQLLFNSIAYLNLPFETIGTNPFTDVASDAPYYYGVLWAADSGVVGGYGNGRFGPSDSITREQMCAILTRTAAKAGLDLPAVNDAIAFKDAGSISSWATDAVRTCQMAGVVGGYPDGTFKPKNTISNAEACVMIYRFLSLLPA